jgi:hypothetical protein
MRWSAGFCSQPVWAPVRGGKSRQHLQAGHPEHAPRTQDSAAARVGGVQKPNSFSAAQGGSLPTAPGLAFQSWYELPSTSHAAAWIEIAGLARSKDPVSA